LDNNKEKYVFEYRGIHGQDYHYTRLNIPTVKFSLNCRIGAISQGIREIFPTGIEKLLDLGSADGLLAAGISAMVPDIGQIYALDMDEKLLNYNQFSAVQADVCKVPFHGDTFDVVTAAALIEHLPDPSSFLQECHRVLKPGGALLLTCPAPFFERVATYIGYLKDAGHVARYNLNDLRRLCEGVGFSVRLAKKFMITPAYFPGHTRAESIVRRIGLSFLMLNQIIGSTKTVR
jgi:SAM-dependent methyltransferase